jgi:protein import protein ZIM17
VGETPKSEGERPEIKPSHYQLSFTCVPCGHRSHHNVSKQGYHFGSTLITCPGCRNRHVISDHLNIFGDKKITIEQLMEKKGQLVKRGTLGEDGDIEFWPENSLRGSKGSNENESSD